MTVYMSSMHIIVCQHLGCGQRATYGVWNDSELIGRFCREHGEIHLAEETRRTDLVKP